MTFHDITDVGPISQRTYHDEQQLKQTFQRPSSLFRPSAWVYCLKKNSQACPEERVQIQLYSEFVFAWTSCYTKLISSRKLISLPIILGISREIKLQTMARQKKPFNRNFAGPAKDLVHADPVNKHL